LTAHGGRLQSPMAAFRHRAWRLIDTVVRAMSVQNIDLLFIQFSSFEDSQSGAPTLFIPELLVLLAIRHLLRHFNRRRAFEIGCGTAHPSQEGPLTQEWPAGSVEYSTT
jgi:branched-subunit amino acid transport protein AzlD